jgi:hypothetical protein
VCCARASGFTTIARDLACADRGLYGAQTLVAGSPNVLIVVSALELFDMGSSGIGFPTRRSGSEGFGALARLR